MKLSLLGVCTGYIASAAPMSESAARHALYGLGCLAFLGLAYLAVFASSLRGRESGGGLSLPDSSPSCAGFLRKALADPSAGTLIGMEPESGLKRLIKEGRPWLLGQEHRERHMQVVGPTRSGKSQLLLAISGQDMSAGRPVFLMEAKGDVSDFRQFCRLAESAGRLSDVRYFNPADPRSMSFNPIRPVPGQNPIAVANQISRAIGREPGGPGDSAYFKNLDYARIQTMAEVFAATGRAFTLRDAFCYFEFKDCREKAFTLCPDQALCGMARRQFGDGLPDTSGLTSQLRPWISGHLGRLLNSYEPQVRLEDLFKRGRLAYFAIPVAHLQVLANPLGRMVVSGLMAVSDRRQRMSRKPGPASVILDEFAQFATPSFTDFIATVGSARFWTIFAHQDLGQLKKVEHPEAFFSAVFSNSSGCKVFFHVPHPADAELVARAAGTTSTAKSTVVVDGGLLGDFETGRKSVRDVEEFVAHPNLLRSLPSGTAVAWGHGRKPAVLRTAACHEVVAAKGDIALPEVAGVRCKGLELASAVPASVRGESDVDFAGLSAGLAGK